MKSKTKKTNGPKPFVPLQHAFVWLAKFEQVWTCDPHTGNSTSRKATVWAFTVAATKAEAKRSLHDGLLDYDDIEDPGDPASVTRLKLASNEVAEGVGALLQQGYRYVIPSRRMNGSLVALVMWLLIVDSQ